MFNESYILEKTIPMPRYEFQKIEIHTDPGGISEEMLAKEIRTIPHPITTQIAPYCEGEQGWGITDLLCWLDQPMPLGPCQTSGKGRSLLSSPFRQVFLFLSPIKELVCPPEKGLGSPFARGFPCPS